MKARLVLSAVMALGLLGAPAAAQPQIKIGAILSISGPGAAMGVGYKGAFDFFPKEIAGQPVEYIIRDDATDASTGYTIAQKMISEDHVDALIGPSLTATDAAVAPLANQAHVPMIAMAPYEYDPAKQPYTFNDAQPLPLMVAQVFKYMQQHGVKTLGYIGFSDGWGDQVLAGTKQAAAADGMTILADERYARTDTSVEAQALKLISVHPQAIMMGNSATPAALPVVALRHLGYKGGIYGNHGIVSPAFIKVGGAAVGGVIADTSPLVVYTQLPDGNPIKPVAEAFMKDYTAKFGPQSVNPFAGYSYDAMLLLKNAIPAALQAGKPGTEQFREALRDALEKTHDLVGVSGIYNMSPGNHNGQDSRAAVLVEVKDGAWKAIQ
ncbi:MAG TPA: ABC transporter substrate-binding protein [Acetobacteraceae bacterium]|nr:ABC transporter substrate-binding protein [Acetobacteraceae bacterium]